MVGWLSASRFIDRGFMEVFVWFMANIVVLAGNGLVAGSVGLAATHSSQRVMGEITRFLYTFPPNS